MADVVLVLTALAFFGVCVLYVAACDRIIGPDETAATDGSSLPTQREAA